MNVAHAEISYDDHTLPSDTLFHVLSLLSFSERRLTISLVCKKWKELTMQHCSPLWRSCNIYVHREAPGFPTLKYHKVVRWLSKHGQAVQPLEITIKDTDEPQQLTSEDWTDLSHTSSIEPLRHLTALESLLLSVDLGSSLHFQLSHHLTDLARLTSLSLVCMCAVGDVPLSTNVASVFSQLVSLRGLELCGLTDTVPASFAKLSELRSLDLANFRKDAPPLTISASFMQCTHLLHVALSELSAATVVDWWGLCQSLVNLLRHREARVRMLVAIGSVPIHPLWVTD
ncbi:hypothetical protein WJX84_000869 [Apatococcus fuscideae]|uniref:F-box domain-containing protein n=1 Tax=Apatococcus fuscideae TaxID=2026836 RepID=A0AAW1SRS6_9CHLO